MTHHDDRLVRLELKVSDLDDWVERLNEQLYRQQMVIERLQSEVARLSARLEDAAPAPFRSLLDERPPHY